jgi:hypothetical protein
MRALEKEMPPRVREHPGGRPTATKEVTVDTPKSSAPAQPATDEKPDDVIDAHYACLERLEERLAHELIDHEERQEVRDRVITLRRRLGR